MIKDCLGNIISVGDQLAVSMSYGNGSTLRIGWVAGIIYDKDKLDIPVKLFMRWTHGRDLPSSNESEFEIGGWRGEFKFVKIG